MPCCVYVASLHTWNVLSVGAKATAPHIASKQIGSRTPSSAKPSPQNASQRNTRRRKKKGTRVRAGTLCKQTSAFVARKPSLSAQSVGHRATAASSVSLRTGVCTKSTARHHTEKQEKV